MWKDYIYEMQGKVITHSWAAQKVIKNTQNLVIFWYYRLQYCMYADPQVISFSLPLCWISRAPPNPTQTY